MILGGTQQVVMKHLAILKSNCYVEEIKVNSKPKVRNLYMVRKPFIVGYTSKNGILCLYIRSGEYKVNTPVNVESLEEITDRRKMLHMRIKVITNRLRRLVEEDLVMQSEINTAMRKLEFSPILIVALRCALGTDSSKHMEEASRVFGFNLRDIIRHIV